MRRGHRWSTVARRMRTAFWQGMVVAYGISATAWAHGPVADQETALRAGLTQSTADVVSLLKLSELLRTNQRYADAAQAAKEALAWEPEQPDALAALGMAQSGAGDPEGGAVTLSRALDARPQAWGWMLERARAYRAAGQLKHAAADYQQVTGHLADADAFLERAAVLSQQQRLADAAAALEEGMVALNGLPLLRAAAIRANARAGQCGRARALVDPVANQQPQWALLRARVLHAQGQHNAAQAQARGAQKLLRAHKRRNLLWQSAWVQALWLAGDRSAARRQRAALPVGPQTIETYLEADRMVGGTLEGWSCQDG